MAALGAFITVLLPLLLQVIKNQSAYYQQARVEVGILQLLNGRLDPNNEHHIVRLHDAFVHNGHLCLAFEQLGINLFELLKRNSFRGLSLGLLRLFLEQVSCVAGVGHVQLQDSQSGSQWLWQMAGRCLSLAQCFSWPGRLVL